MARQINEDLIKVSDDGIKRLKYEAIETVHYEPVPASYTVQQYGERPSPYKVILKGEKIRRRVYVTPIGNASVYYIHTKLGAIYCEIALDAALHRV